VIAVRLQGRLGNQLFQFAFAIVISKKLNTGFIIDQYIERSAVDKYFKRIEGPFPWCVSKLFKITGYKNLFTFYLRRVYFRNLILFKKLSLIECDYETPAAEITIQNNTVYQGYFQSETFFKSFENLIKQTFVLKDFFVKEFNEKYSALYKSNKIITIHIRRTDYLNLGHLNLGGDDLSLPVEYYKNAISKFDRQNVHFVFISDDIDFVQKNFGEIGNKTVSQDSEIMDFQHLLNADGCIISNSTFSWWGAWLNNKTEKIIYAPQYFMGWRVRKETPLDIYPKEWIKIDFNAE
jgi:hypothetical protein